MVLVLLSPVAVHARVASQPPVPGERRWKGVDARLAELEDGAEFHRASAEALAFIHDRYQWHDEDPDPRRLPRFLERLVTLPGTHPVVRDHARLIQLRLALEQGDLRAAASLRQGLGILTGYWMVGPFENTGGAGLLVNHGPDEEPALDRSWDGMSRSVKWRRVDDVGPSGVLALHDHLWPSDEVLGYALVFIRSAREQDAALRVGASDQLVVRVNGRNVLVDDAMHTISPDQHAVGIHLRQGWNALMFKVGQLRSGWNLTARLTSPDGSPLTDWEASLDPAVATEATRAAPMTAPVAAWDPLAVLAARVNAPGTSLAAAQEQIFRLRRALHVDDERVEPPPRVLALETALREAPRDPYLLTALAAERGVQDVNRARDLYEAALKTDSGFAPAWLGLGGLRMRQELNAEARRALEKAVAADGNLMRAVTDLADQRWSQSPDPDRAIRELESAVKRRLTVVGLETLMHLEQNRGALNRALTWALKLRTLRPGHRSARGVIMEVARRKHDLPTLLAEYDVARSLDPHNDRPVLEQTSLMFSMGKRTEALSLLTRFATTHPDATAVWEALGQMKHRHGDVAGAVAAYQESLAVRPQNAELRRHVEVLNGEDHFEDRYQLDLAALMAAPPPPGAEAAGGYVLGHILAHRLFDNGLTTQVVDVAYRLLDRTKAPLVRELSAAYTPGREALEILRVERITPNGETFTGESEEHDAGRQVGVYSDLRRMTVNFGAVNAGDVLRLRYRIDAAGERNLFGDFFGLVDYTQEPFPKARYDLVVEAPVGRPLNFRTVRLPEVTTERRSDRTVYRLSARDIPALALEPNMAPYTEVGAYVVGSTYARWQDLGRWYASLVRDQLMLDSELKTLAHSLVEGATDEVERIRRIHYHVLRKTRYVAIELGIHGWKPYRVTQVHARGYGDCKDKASLLVALLNEIGIEARLVLIRTWNQGPLVDLASMWAFNHAIAYVPSQRLFLDGTAEYSGLQELPFMDQDAMALAVDVRTGAVERVNPPLAPASANVNTSSYVIQVDATGRARLAGEERFTGQRAPEHRMRFQDGGNAQADMEREFSALYPGAHVERFKLNDLSNLDEPVVYTFEAEIPAFGTPDPDSNALLLPISLYPHELEREYAPLTNRTQDVVLSFPSTTRNKMRFVLPPGMVADGLPPTTRLNTPHVEFNQLITPTADGYVVEEITVLKSRRVPVKAYDAFRQALVEADRKMRLKVKLVRRTDG